MITEYLDKIKTRMLYEEAFDDPKEFVDYYYNDKCLDNRMIVSIEDNSIVSMLHLNPYRINLCGTEVLSYYVVAVATKKEWQGKGQMKKVFERTFEILKKEHIPFIYLLPVDEAIYSWMGFEKICDFSMNRYSDFEEIKGKYDVFCTWDDNYIRRMKREEELRKLDKGEVLPDNPVIMGKIIDLKEYNRATGNSFISEHEALQWLREKRIYICEEV